MSASDHPPPRPPAGRGAPAPLLVAASLAGLEAVLLVGYGVALVPAIHGSRLAMGVTTPVFFVVYGVALAWFAWQVARLRSWARAPLVLAQLIQLGLASSFWGGPSTVAAVIIGVVAVIVLAGIFHPASLAALAHDDG
ncbi:MAG TPA: hypothetical protein VFJ19_13700 [Nocardioidaceae bacterium]|nr:hypothetical protein [Nocardioidaceae bacterium]